MIRLALAPLTLLLAVASAAARPESSIWLDPRGDASARRTDPTASGPIDPATVLPDLLSATLLGWSTPTPATNPYNGSPEANHPLFFRLDLQFAGLINPPGPLDAPFDPFRFGPSPLYGFIDIDIDQDCSTGGELTAQAVNRYLANVARFGRVPTGDIHTRAVASGAQIDGDFSTAPQFERTGAEFSLVLCGCREPVIISESGNGNHIFESGETWVVQSDFFQRAGGLRDACFSFGGLSGVPGMYDPAVNLRFSHDSARNVTTVTLVYPLDNAGSALLRGDPFVEPHDLDGFDAGNQNSIAEALDDLILGASTLILTDPTRTLALGWRDRHWQDYLDPGHWRLSALVGTSYSVQQPGYPFVWTDTGFTEVAGDQDGDGQITSADVQHVRQVISFFDGTPLDGDGVGFENGTVTLLNPGANFNSADINGDGRIEPLDERLLCLADFNTDGRLDVADIIAFLTGFAAGDPRADINHSQSLDINDFVVFSVVFAGGCP